MDENNSVEFEAGFKSGLVGVVRADGNVSVREAGSLAMVAGGNLDVTEGGAGLLVAGGNVTVHQGGAGNMIIGGGAEISEASVGQMVTLQTEVKESRIGLLVAGSATVEKSEILLTTEQAVGFGVAAGLVFFLLRKFFGRG